MSLSKKSCSYIELNFVIPILDMPELVLECILEKLPPEGLYNMSSVCKSLREKCISDHLWVKHMNRKWGKVVGPAVYKEWKWQIASIKDPIFFNQINPKGLLRYISNLWPSTLVRYDSKNSILIKKTSLSSPVDSVMSLYLVLETGKFWFPAQVYNRENGDAGFVVSCYDAELSYNPINDTFQARYPPHGNRSMAEEIGVKWDRLRASPIDIAPHDLHISDCLNDLCPGDHIEIQWRINTQFPYGWWYGVIGHLEPCFGNPSFCSCRQSETMVLEFNQYKMGSRWRTTFINRKEHREEGNEDVGFYGGIRKLVNYEDISTWKRFWPPQNMD